jgi:hypothetical protein
MRLADVFATHWDGYRQRYAKRLCTAHHRAAEAIMRCRTPAQGGLFYRCLDCGQVHGRYYSCHHRSCPQCGGIDQQHWAATQSARLIPCDYYLLTFTIPKELRRIFHRHQKPLYELFFHAVAATIKEMAADTNWLGGEAGFIAILHTWTRQLLYHPHIHVLMPGVALAPEHNRILRPTKGRYLVAGDVVAAMLRNRVDILFKKRHPKWHASLPPSIWSASWVADVENVGCGKEALRYLSAYVAKCAITDSRILGEDTQGRILVRWFDRDKGNAPRTMTLHPYELIRRVLLHVLPKALMKVRHYGWLSPAAKRRFARVRLLLGVAALPAIELISMPAHICQHCGSARLQLAGQMLRARGPPALRPNCCSP